MSDNKGKAAIYARYSSDRQSPTSIEDQVRLCRELALREGYEVLPDHVFADRAITGTKSGVTLREGFAQLARAIKSGEIRCVIIDEISRAGRDAMTLVSFVEELDKRNVRLLVRSSGLDSFAPHFMMYFSVMMGMAAQESENTRHRTSRGMIGVLERGGMIGYPPFGYQLVPRVDEVSGKGATFIVDEPQAALVKEMFEARVAGLSFNKIAKSMQMRGIPIPRRKQKENGGFWRPGTVKQLLSNTLYKGVFTWNGSNFAKAAAKKKGRPLKTIEFARPELQIIETQLWEAAQSKPGQNPRKGYKHSYNRRVTCGVCQSTTSLHYRGSVVILMCASCDGRRRALDTTNNFSQVSVRALDSLIADIFARIEPLGVLENYRSMLLALVNNDNAAEIENLTRRCRELEKRISTVAKMLTRNEGDGVSLSDAYERLAAEKDATEARLESLVRTKNQVSPATIEKHLESLEPFWYLKELFSKHLDPARANELIGRIFPEIIFRKVDKNNSHWVVHVNLAELQLPGFQSAMPQVGKVEFEYRVRCNRRAPTSYEPELVSHRLLSDCDVVSPLVESECFETEAAQAV